MPEIFITECLRTKFQSVNGDRFVEFYAPRPLRGGPKSMQSFGHTLSVERWGKTLYFRSEEVPHVILASTLGSAGDWYLSDPMQSGYDFQQQLSARHENLNPEKCRYIFKLISGRYLAYYDHLEFGTLEFLDLPREGSPQGYLFPRPDVLDPRFNLDHINPESTMAIYHQIHSQNPFPGMGACLGAEWLFRANVNPRDSVRDVFRHFGKEHLLTALRETRMLGLAAAELLREDRITGSYHASPAAFPKVYRQEKEVCVRCESAVIALFDNLRGGQYCPKCQPSLS